MRPVASLRARLTDDAGYTLVELLVASVLLVILLGAIGQIFVSAQRANTDATARLTSQQNVRLAFDRLEYDARCASNASILSDGGGVHLTFPSQLIPCAHATGDVSWCVNSGSLVRISGTSCSATGQAYIASVTSATPFSCYTAPGITSPLPELKVALTVDTTSTAGDATTATDYITMHNAAPGNCS